MTAALKKPSLVKRFRQRIADLNSEYQLLSLRPSPLMRTLMFYFWNYPFTPAGQLVAAGVCISGLVGAVTVEAPVYQMFMSLTSLLLVSSAVGSALRWTGVTIEGRFPEKVNAGQILVGTFVISNRGWLPTYDVSVACFLLPDGWSLVGDAEMVPRLRRHDTVKLQVRLKPSRRGCYSLPAVRVYTTFPFNLFRNELARIPGGTVLVLPTFHPANSLALHVGNRYQPGGIALTSHIGESPEYIGNRDYMPGDSMRRIDFRSWGRLAKPVVKEYQEEYYCRIGLVLDTYIAPRRRPGRKGFADLEAAVSMTATLADALSRGESIIDLFAAGPELHVFRAGRHTAHFENVLEILAGIGPCRTNPFHEVAPALVDALGRISTVVCVFLDWDEPRRQLIRACLEAGCQVKVVIIRDKPTTLPIEQRNGLSLECLTPQRIAAGGFDVL